MAQAPSFIIEEQAGSRRKVELKGRALPYRGVAFGQDQRTKKTNYPGNPVATQQVLGPEYPDTEIHGEWKDRFLDPDVKVTNDPIFPRPALAEDLILLMYDIQRSGNPLRIQWGFEVRGGILKRFIPTYDRLEDVKWSMEFEWNNRDDEVAPRGAVEPDLFSSLLGFLNALDDALSFEPLPGLIEDFAAQLLDGIDRIRGTIGKLFDIIRTANAILSLPGQLLGALEAAVTSLIDELLDEIGRLTDNSSDNTTRAREVADVLLYDAWKRQVAVAMANLAGVIIQLNQQTQSNANPPATVFITTKAETTLYQLSIAFFGTPDFANFILRANRAKANAEGQPGLRDGVVPAGQIIAIPPRPINDPGIDCT